VVSPFACMDVPNVLNERLAVVMQLSSIAAGSALSRI
jgi:hypothetical protein